MSLVRDTHTAALEGDVVTLNRLLKTQPRSREAKNLFGWTPLHTAAYARQYGVAELLIKSGADPNVRDRNGQSPLQVVMEIDPGSPVVALLCKDNAQTKSTATGAGLWAQLTKKSTRWLGALLRSKSD